MNEQRPWFDEVQSYYWIHNVVHLHRELNFWLLRRGENGALTWMELNGVGRQMQPYHYEIFHDRAPARNAYYSATMEQAAREGRMVIGRLHGFSDLFFPVPGDPAGRTFLHAGQFLTDVPDWESLSQSWHSITGREAVAADADFAGFVKMALALPIIAEPVLQGLEQFCLLYARYLTRTDVSPQHHRLVDQVRREGFVKSWPSTDWIDSAVSSEKFRLTPWYHEGKLVEWMREEMKIQRLPTTVLALMPREPPDERRSGLETSVRHFALQRALIHATFEMPHTAATRLGDYGVFFVTSADPKKAPGAARIELTERARLLQEVARVRGFSTVVGIGPSVPAGEPLAASYRAAIHALHLCVQLEQDLLFFDEKTSPQEGEVRYTHVERALQLLSDACDRGQAERIKLSSDDYVRTVLVYAQERKEVVRGHFLTAIFRLIGGVEKRHAVGSQALDRLADELSRQLEDADSLSRLIETFKDVLARLAFYTSPAAEGPKSLRLESSLAYLEEHFSEPLRLPEVAKRAGFSVPAFSRLLRQATGTSFVTYLRNIRVERAKLLLRTTKLSTADVATQCGFQSAHHLIRSFKKVTDRTPGAYRRWAKIRQLATSE